MKKRTINLLSIISFISSLCFALLGMVLPPLGVIDGSILIWIAQLLTYSAACLQIIKKPNNLK